MAASQTLNRYAYVGNNPCSFTDPSGHFIGLILGFAFGHLTTTLTAKVTLGAVIGGLQAAIHGGDWGDVLQGAALGGVGAGVAHGIGGHFGHNPAVFDFGNEFGRALTHGLSQGGLHDIAGGSYEDGFLGGFFGSVGSSITNSPGFGNTFDTRSSRLFAAVVIGGTASDLGGGKFGNGALSAAFVEMFGNFSLPNRKISELDNGAYQLLYGGENGILSVGTKAQMKALAIDLDKIYLVPEGGQIINDIISKDTIVTISLNNENATKTLHNGRKILFDSSEPEIRKIPSFARLGHELQHSRDLLYGDQIPTGPSDRYRFDGTTPPWEKKALDIEIKLQKHYWLKPVRLEYYEAIPLEKHITYE